MCCANLRHVSEDVTVPQGINEYATKLVAPLAGEHVTVVPVRRSCRNL